MTHKINKISYRIGEGTRLAEGDLLQPQKVEEREKKVRGCYLRKNRCNVFLFSYTKLSCSVIKNTRDAAVDLCLSSTATAYMIGRLQLIAEQAN